MPSSKPNHLDLSIDSSKHLSEFYTKYSNAQLLAHCTLRFPNDAWNFLPLVESWREFFVGDFACGEGSLLKALYLEMKDILVEKNAQVGTPPQLTAFHKMFVEDLCFGFDVVKDAIVTAVENIFALEPSLPNTHGNFYALPLGITPTIRLGSLDLLKVSVTKTVPSEITGSQILPPNESQLEVPIHLPLFQVVLLNPPFARSCGDNLLFGTLPKLDRDMLVTELKRVRREIGTAGIGQAGQAADFIYLAQQKVAPGGRFSFIVPKSLSFGPSWKKVRSFLTETVEIECIFFNYEYPHYGFSEHTQLSECMVIARNKIPKLRKHNEEAARTLVVNILTSPTGAAELQSLQREVVRVFSDERERSESEFVPSSALIQSPQRTSFFISQKLLYDYSSNWAQVLGFYSPILNRIHFQLIHDNTLAIPGLLHTIQIPLTPLRSLGTIGYDRKQVTENTVDGPGAEQLLAVWGRDNRDLNTITVKPTGFRHMKLGKTPHLYQDLQRSASHLLLPETTWLETTRVFSVLCTEQVVSNVFWTFSPDPTLQTLDRTPITAWELEQILALWGNSSLGILLFLGMRQETRGPWVHWKKRSLGEMLVLDITQLTRSQINSLLTSGSQFLPRETLYDTPFMLAIVAREKMSMDLSLFQILQATAPDPLPLDALKQILVEFYQTFSNPEINSLGLA